MGPPRSQRSGEASWGKGAAAKWTKFLQFWQKRVNVACKDAKRQGSRKAACALWERGGTVKRAEIPRTAEWSRAKFIKTQSVILAKSC